jgi:hypothetical protein
MGRVLVGTGRATRLAIYIHLTYGPVEEPRVGEHQKNSKSFPLHVREEPAEASSVMLCLLFLHVAIWYFWMLQFVMFGCRSWMILVLQQVSFHVEVTFLFAACDFGFFFPNVASNEFWCWDYFFAKSQLVSMDVATSDFACWDYLVFMLRSVNLDVAVLFFSLFYTISRGWWAYA